MGEFLSKLKDLYGQQRSFLIPGWWGGGGRGGERGEERREGRGRRERKGEKRVGGRGKEEEGRRERGRRRGEEEEGKRKRKEEAVTTMLKPIQNILVIKSTHSHANCMSPLSDMHSFVPEEDRAEFEDFLVQHNLRPTGQAVRDTGTHPPATVDLQVPEGRRGRDRKPTKQRSSRKHGSHVADVDRFLQDIDAQMNTMADTN